MYNMMIAAQGFDLIKPANYARHRAATSLTRKSRGYLYHIIRRWTSLIGVR